MTITQNADSNPDSIGNQNNSNATGDSTQTVNMESLGVNAHINQPTQPESDYLIGQKNVITSTSDTSIETTDSEETKEISIEVASDEAIEQYGSEKANDLLASFQNAKRQGNYDNYIKDVLVANGYDVKQIERQIDVDIPDTRKIAVLDSNGVVSYYFYYIGENGSVNLFQLRSELDTSVATPQLGELGLYQKGQTVRYAHEMDLYIYSDGETYNKEGLDDIGVSEDEIKKLEMNSFAFSLYDDKVDETLALYGDTSKYKIVKKLIDDPSYPGKKTIEAHIYNLENNNIVDTRIVGHGYLMNENNKNDIANIITFGGTTSVTTKTVPVDFAEVGVVVAIPDTNNSVTGKYYANVAGLIINDKDKYISELGNSPEVERMLEYYQEKFAKLIESNKIDSDYTIVNAGLPTEVSKNATYRQLLGMLDLDLSKYDLLAFGGDVGYSQGGILSTGNIRFSAVGTVTNLDNFVDFGDELTLPNGRHACVHFVLLPKDIVDPDEITTPDEPVIPDEPTIPDTPDVPGKPKEPVIPDTTTIPETPNTPVDNKSTDIIPAVQSPKYKPNDLKPVQTAEINAASTQTKEDDNFVYQVPTESQIINQSSRPNPKTGDNTPYLIVGLMASLFTGVFMTIKGAKIIKK
ncbi:MAG: hypothetical protein K6F69_08135 [Treponema sp.]|nr:hypothetical protein [Treponema sp.]